MKSLLKNLLLVFFASTLLLTGCRKEESELIQAPTEEVLNPNSMVASLMQRVALVDGSVDNIIDNANCFVINLPVTVIVNGIEVVVNTPADYQLIEDILDESDDDVDTVEIVFPITVTLADFTEVTINNVDEFLALVLTCPGEGDSDDDIECLDFQYPITATVFNTVTEVLETVIIESDAELYAFLEDVGDDEVINIEFPIYVILADGTVVEINSLVELENVIEEAEDSCDEDDDYDYDDDDCEDCTTDDLADLLTGCSPWFVDKLERDDEDLEDDYVGYDFTFTADGDIIVEFGSDTATGTWASEGTGTSITVEIDIADLPDFNANWILHEIETSTGESHVDLRLGDDRLRFESDCDGSGGDDPSAAELIAVLTDGAWYVTNYFDDVDQTNLFCDYVFEFGADGSAVAVNGDGSTPGEWEASSSDSGLDLFLNFGTSIPLDELMDDWDVEEFDENIIRLRDVSGGDGTVDTLVFGRSPVDCDGGTPSDLEAVLTDGAWFVTNYFDDVDQTNLFCDYTFEFALGGTAAAANGDGSTPGSWMITTSDSGLDLILDFGTGIPLDELMDDWEVVEFDENIIRLRDISGGDGSEDILVFGRTPVACDDPPGDVEATLIDGTWIVALYMDGADNDTAIYSAYEINFNADGTVIAESDTDLIDGTWDVLSGGSTLLLDFGTDIPFDEFNDDWDVFSVEPARVEVRDVSGGDGTLSILVFEKL